MISLTTYSYIVMVGGLPTDIIVILYDSIHQIFLYHLLTNLRVMVPTGVGKSTVCSSGSSFRIVILTYDVIPLIVHQQSPRARCHGRRP